MGKLFALIGHPVGHSLSPMMHNDAFAAMGLPHQYQGFDVSPVDLKDAVIGMKALGVSGFNITVPHKVAVMQYLDAIDEEAERMGAVNTVVNENGSFLGTNTDGRGYLLSLQETVGENLSKKNILMIGAGGAARGVAFTLDRFGVRRLDVANRTVEKAESLVKSGIYKSATHVLTLGEAAQHLGDYDIVINTTSVGMSPHIDHVPLPLNGISPGTVLSDLIYNPLQTKWLEEGKKRGATTMNGVGMFVNQGAFAFEYWTGQEPNRERMWQTVLNQLYQIDHSKEK